MPNTGVYLELTPDADTFTPVLTGIEERLIDIVPAYDAVYAAFRKIEAKRFSAEGPGWAPLAAATVADRERYGIPGAHPILNRSGATYRGRTGGQLRRSLTTKGAKNAVVQPMPDGLIMGTADPIAPFHQDGTHGAGRDHNVSMPARPLIDLTEADAQLLAGVIGEWVYGFAVTEASAFGATSDTRVFQAAAV